MLGALRTMGRRTARTIALRPSELLEGFLLALAAAGRTPATRQWYESRIRRLVLEVQDVPAREITVADIRRALVAVKAGTAEPVSDGYVESHRKAWSRFFAWSCGEGLLEQTPMANIPKYKVARREIHTLTHAEIERLIEAQPENTHEGARNRAMIAFLYDTGVRVGELVTIGIGDVDWTQSEARVIGKSRRQHRVPMSPTLRAALWTYVHVWRPRTLAFADSGRLFVARNGEALRPTAVNQWLTRAKKRAGLADTRIYPHLFRHSMGTAYIRNGGDVGTLQLIFDHTTASTTMRYLHLVQSDVKARHAVASPLERLVRDRSSVVPGRTR